MKTEEKSQILARLDWERQTVVFPGVTRFAERGVIREVFEGGKEAMIAYSSSGEAEIDEIIKQQLELARSSQYELEWKLYGHDQPACLAEHLITAGFQAEAREAFLVLLASEEALRRFRGGKGEIKQVTDRSDLQDYRRILEEVNGVDCEQRIKHYADLLENHPDNLSIYLAYVEGEPAACGRISFHEESEFGALAGGNTRVKFRGQGLFQQIVAARIREALNRGISKICVDALPTSEPILKKRGFETVTYTQPFVLEMGD